MRFPTEMLPDVVQPGEKAGALGQIWFGIPKTTAVLSAFGDFQMGILPHIQLHTAGVYIFTRTVLYRVIFHSVLFFKS